MTRNHEDRRGFGLPAWGRGAVNAGERSLATFGLAPAAANSLWRFVLIGGLVTVSAVVGSRMRAAQDETEARQAKAFVHRRFASTAPTRVERSPAVSRPGEPSDGTALVRASGMRDAPAAGSPAATGGRGGDPRPEEAAATSHPRPGDGSRAADAFGGEADEAAETGSLLPGDREASVAKGSAPPSSGFPSSGFGALSSSLGGRVNGGAGLSGGIGSGFERRPLSNVLLAAASGARDSLSASVSTRHPRRGRVFSWASRRRVTAAARSSAPAERLRRLTALGAYRGGDEASSHAHAAAWDGATSSGQQVSGPGAGVAAAATASGASTGSSAPGSTSWGASRGEGGPILVSSESKEDEADKADAKEKQDDASTVPEIGAEKNATPYQNMIDQAKLLLLVALGLLAAAAVLGLLAKSVLAAPVLATLARFLAFAAMLVAAIVTCLGIAIMAYGQVQQGLIFTLAGAALTYASYKAAEEFTAPEEAATKIDGINVAKGQTTQANLEHTGALQGDGSAQGPAHPSSPAESVETYDDYLQRNGGRDPYAIQTGTIHPRWR